MAIIKSGVFHVLEKFPDHAEDIKRLYKENQDFQIMCEDYRQCSTALRYWNRSASEEAPARREEYGMLLRDLEEEILRTFDEK